MPSIWHYAIMSYCPLLMKNHNFYDGLFKNRVILIKTVSNLFILPKCFSPSSNIVYITIFLQELLPFVHEILPLFAMYTF